MFCRAQQQKRLRKRNRRVFSALSPAQTPSDWWRRDAETCQLLDSHAREQAQAALFLFLYYLPWLVKKTKCQKYCQYFIGERRLILCLFTDNLLVDIGEYSLRFKIQPSSLCCNAYFLWLTLAIIEQDPWSSSCWIQRITFRNCVLTVLFLDSLSSI